MNYRYQLQKYNGRNSRLTCPHCGRKNCFTPYVDGQGRMLSPEVGKCDHEHSCGYHLPPRTYLALNPDRRPLSCPVPTLQSVRVAEKTNYLSMELIRQLEGPWDTLLHFLAQKFGREQVERVRRLYHVGVTERQEIVFPQIDEEGRCRTAKLMTYEADGHRRRCGRGAGVDWLHARLMKNAGRTASDYHLRQCLFGQHLLRVPDYEGKTVCIVESEKSALVCSLFFGDKLWMACGGKQGLTAEHLRPLRSRNVMLVPDADAADEWREKLPQLAPSCRRLALSAWSDHEPAGSKRDLADIVLAQPTLSH